MELFLGARGLFARGVSYSCLPVLAEQDVMRYPLLDPLRGLAAIWVFLHHLVYTFPVPAVDLLRLGYFGVPMFFVISGYCLTAAGRRAVQTNEAPGRFLLRRALRVYPPFWCAAVLGVTVYALVPLAGAALSPYEAHVRESWRAVGSGEWIGVLTLTTAFRPSGELLWDKFRPVNPVFWTLAIEVQFYAVVSLAVRAGRRFYGVLIGVTVASIPFLPSASAFSSGWFLPFWPFFALGIGLYAAREAAPGGVRFALWQRGVILLGAVVLAGFGLVMAPLEPNGSRAMILGEFAFAVGLTAVLWVSWRPPGEKHPGGLVTNTARYLGAASYSIYLLHIPLMILFGHAIARVLTPDSVAFLLAAVVVVCAAVYPFYRWVEQPCMTAGRGPRAASLPTTGTVRPVPG